MAKKQNPSQFGLWLTKQRLTNGLSIGKVAEASGVTYVGLQKIERGQTQAPRPETVKAIEDGISTLVSDGIGEFGVWLRSSRETRKLSVPQLAEQVGISAQSIYNLENGRTQNPNSATRLKIETILNAQAPKAVVETAAKAASVIGLGSLQEFDPYAFDLIPDEPGVYVLYDIADRPIYVGRSKRIRRRLKNHQNAFWYKRPIVVSAAFIRVEDETLRNQIEETLIKFLKSNAVINKVNVDRDLEE